MPIDDLLVAVTVSGPDSDRWPNLACRMEYDNQYSDPDRAD